MDTNRAETAACSPSCGCRAYTAQDALAATLDLLGHVNRASDPQSAASAVLYLLRDYGWKLVRDDA